jgi:hypothetical protein
MEEGEQIVRTVEVRVSRAGLSLRQWWYEAIKLAKAQCVEPIFKNAVELPPKCEHGVPIAFSWRECQECDSDRQS